jgi:hypothetical protein
VGTKLFSRKIKSMSVLEQQEWYFFDYDFGKSKAISQGGSNIFFHSLGGIMCDSNQAKKLIDTLPQLSKQAALLGITKE